MAVHSRSAGTLVAPYPIPGHHKEGRVDHEVQQVGVLAVTVVGAMGIRVLTGAGAPLSFVIVMTTVLALFLLGWRGLVALRARRRGRVPLS